MFGMIPRDKVFFDLFESATEVVVRAAEAYDMVSKDYASREQQISRIRQLEHDCDEIAHNTLDRLDKTFITPFDREDIQTLMMQIDDIVDEIDAASKRLTLYQIPQPTPWFIKQTDVLLRAAKLLHEAMPKLRRLSKPNGLHDKLVEIHRLENIGDDNNHAALAELLNQCKDPILVMKWKEIYDLTERAIDGCEDVANTIAGVVLKNS
jgi:predicted phosphate transport protein (TIGR00153 family)